MKHSKKAFLGLAVLILIAPKCFSHTPQQQTESNRLQIGVRVYNDARVPDAQMRAAEEVVAQVLRQVGIGTEWSDCTVVGGVARSDSPSCAAPLRSRDLVVYFVDRLDARFPWVHRNTLGCSIIPHTPELASSAYVSYSRIQELAASTSAGVKDLLGLAVAHEIGHLLFGTLDHANQGIMRAPWRLLDLEDKSWGEFHFTNEQGKRLRSAVEARYHMEEIRIARQ